MDDDNRTWDSIPDEPPVVFTVHDEPPAWMDEASEAWRREQEAVKQREPLPLIDPSEWGDDIDPPRRRWTVEGMVPHGQATLITGAGSAGKSLAEQQQATCVAMGLPWLGIDVESRHALYISCEDDVEELWRRQKAICAALGIKMSDLKGRLYLLSLAGKVDNELATFDERGRIHVADRMRDIEDACGRHEIGFVVLDNTGHFFSGNENDRHQVASFVGLCNGLAGTIDGAVVIIGHPNKAGGEYSGSTAWENQVRSRLFMEIPKNTDGSVDDPDRRVITRGKSNYAQKGAELHFRWHEWAFVREDDLPDDKRAETVATAQAGMDNDLFLKCLRERTRQKRAVSERVSKAYAPTVFAAMPEAKGASRARMEAAMDRLFRLGRIERSALWKGPDRKPVFGLREVAGNVAGNAQKMGAGNLRETAGNHMRGMRDEHSPSTTYVGAVERPPSTYGPESSSDWQSNPLLNPAAASLEPPAWLDDRPPFDPDDWPDGPDWSPDA